MFENEVQRFIQAWEYEAKNTVKLLQALPTTQYDFRPVKDWRSLGELAWHLAEVDAYMSDGAARGKVDLNAKIPNLERPRTVEALAPGFERVHADAVERVRRLTPNDFDRKMPFFDGQLAIRDLLWGALLGHSIHHRGELVLMCRLAGGIPPGIYGPNREELMAMMKARG